MRARAVRWALLLFVACGARSDLASYREPVVSLSAAGNHVCVVRRDGTAACAGVLDVQRQWWEHPGPIDDTACARRLREPLRLVASSSQADAYASDSAVAFCAVPDDPVWSFSKPMPEAVRSIAVGADGDVCSLAPSGRITCTAGAFPPPGAASSLAIWGTAVCVVQDGAVVCGEGNGAIARVEVEGGARIARMGDSGGCVVGEDAFAYCVSDGGHVLGRMSEVPRAVTTVSGSRDSGCATLSDGELWCWGDNTHGQAGIGTVSAFEPAHRVPIAEIAAVAVAPAFVCALNARGRVLCWGDNRYGQIAGATSEMVESPVQAM